TLLDEPTHAALVGGDPGELRAELFDLLQSRSVARVDLGDLTLDVGGVLGEPRLLDAGDFVALRNGLALFGYARRQPAAPGKRKSEALLFCDGEEADGLARVILVTDELSIPPRPGQSDTHRQDDPEGLFHGP